MNKLLEKIKYLIPAITSLLSSLGGQGIKEFRRVILPIVLSIFGFLEVGYWGISLGLVGIFMAIGYGIPDYSFSTVTSGLPIIFSVNDEGSTLGRFWYKFFRYNHLLADVFTRGTIGLGVCLTILSIPLLKNNWVMYALGCLLIMLGQTVFSYRGLGVIKFKNGELLWSDLINYFLMGLGYLVILI